MHAGETSKPMASIQTPSEDSDQRSHLLAEYNTKRHQCRRGKQIRECNSIEKPAKSARRPLPECKPLCVRDLQQRLSLPHLLAEPQQEIPPELKNSRALHHSFARHSFANNANL
ncbi:hypothetical protein DPMN_148977 [Dreissena polymorpha]|uniref:Uncharacterized protein n=1 Tax=Dreissena polymorpha TaxID=45954 RepID=A0A9D4J4W1_DREPO|nr:hypothetical protein DPMN_148977 [Dreissena polymorpha]